MRTFTVALQETDLPLYEELSQRTGVPIEGILSDYLHLLAVLHGNFFPLEDFHQ